MVCGIDLDFYFIAPIAASQKVLVAFACLLLQQGTSVFSVARAMTVTTFCFSPRGRVTVTVSDATAAGPAPAAAAPRC